MKQSQLIEIVGEVKKTTEVKQGKSDYASCGVTVYTGKDKQTGQHKSQWYTIIALGDAISDLVQCGEKGNLIKVIGSFDLKVGNNREGQPTIYGTIFAKHVEFLGSTQNKYQPARKQYVPPQPQAPIINDGLFINDEDVPF